MKRKSNKVWSLSIIKSQKNSHQAEFYFQLIQQTEKEENKEITFKEITSEISTRFSKLDEKEKEKYNAIIKLNRDKYD